MEICKGTLSDYFSIIKRNTFEEKYIKYISI